MTKSQTTSQYLSVKLRDLLKKFSNGKPNDDSHIRLHRNNTSHL